MADREYNVFISWSGSKGKEIGAEVSKWLQMIVQNAAPFFSPDMKPGTLWRMKISGELVKQSLAIVIMTDDAEKSTWVTWETGALAFNNGAGENDACIASILFTKDPKTFKDHPLNAFQYVFFEKQSMWKLIKSIIDTISPNANMNSVEKLFELEWDEFKSKIESIVGKQTPKQESELRELESEMRAEMLESEMKRMRAEMDMMRSDYSRQKRYINELIDGASKERMIIPPTRVATASDWKGELTTSRPLETLYIDPIQSRSMSAKKKRKNPESE